MNMGNGAAKELPFDIIGEILVRLPVRSLCRFKCVCKPFLFLISNPNFAKQYLDPKNKKRKQQTERLLYISTESHECYSLDLESSESTAVKVSFLDEQENPMKFTMVSNSCNGLVLLFYLNDFIFLGNPSTREYRKLPECPFFINSKSAVDGYGFGYDSSCDEYKVVKISLHGSEAEVEADENVVSVYNVKGNSWRRIKSSPHRFLLLVDLHGFFVNGALHWLGVDNVIALHLGSESFHAVPLPRSGGGNIEALDVIGDHLCGFNFNFDQSVLCNVWVMKEYGVRDSWVKFSVVNSPSSIRWMLPSRTGKLLLYTGTTIAFYDLKAGAFEEITVQNFDTIYYVTYEESLIGLQQQYAYGEQN